MAQEDFYGTWNVLNTAGTHFGVGSTLEISDACGLQVDVTVHVPFPGGTLTLNSSGSYNGNDDTVVVSAGTQTTFISRYVDEDTSFHALYGLAVDDVGSAPPHRMAVWMAKREVPRIPQGEIYSPPHFDGEYVVRSAVNAQFGIESGIAIRSTGTEVIMRNVLLGDLPGPDSFEFDRLTCSLRGSTTSPSSKVVVQVSLASLASFRGVYGLAIVGDPEQAGTWGAEDEGT